MPYDLYPAVDEAYSFPPEVRHALSVSPELRNTVVPMTTAIRNNLLPSELWDGRVIANTTTDHIERYDAGTAQWYALSDAADLANKLSKTGDSMTGPLTLIAPTQPNHAARYVDGPIRFATIAARDAAIPTPVKGMECVVETAPLLKQIYDGTTWRNVFMGNSYLGYVDDSKLSGASNAWTSGWLLNVNVPAPNLVIKLEFEAFWYTPVVGSLSLVLERELPNLAYIHRMDFKMSAPTMDVVVTTFHGLDIAPAVGATRYRVSASSSTTAVGTDTANGRFARLTASVFGTTPAY